VASWCILSLATVDAGNLAVTKRWQGPYGLNRGTQASTWPDKHGFIGGYQTTTKRFVDPAGFEHYVRGVDSKALDAYVDGVLEGKVPNVTTRYLNRGRVAHWDPDKSAVVIEDGAGGTVFTPRVGRTYFDDLK